jgi:hypothetical protein
VDPELLALPDPPRTSRTLTVLLLALATAASLAMAGALRRDVAYAFGADSPVNVGDLGTASDDALAASEGALVRADGTLGAAGGIRYERPFVADTFRMLPVLGRAGHTMWVEVRVPAGQESGRWEPPHAFIGRLVRFDAAGPRHRGLRGAIEDVTHEAVPAGAWLLVDGEDPAHARWSIVLTVLFLGFAAWNVASIARILRRVR